MIRNARFLLVSSCCIALASCQKNDDTCSASKESLIGTPNFLFVELRNASIKEGDSIEIDFVLINKSKADIFLAERWNSWGAYQWRFIVIDKTGVSMNLSNPQMEWSKNFFTTFTIPPSSEYTMKCRLDMNTARFNDGTVCIFTAGTPHANNWRFPVSILGVFSAKVYDKSKDFPGTNWNGEIKSKPFLVEDTR